MNIVLTGCSQGIGREIALLCGKSKENKIVGIARNGEALKELTKILSPLVFKGIPFDLNLIFDQSDVFIEQVMHHFDHIDILINNAGALINQSFMDTRVKDYKNIFNTNIFAPAELIRLLLPYMAKVNTAHIVNIGSMAGFHGSEKYNGLSWYSASKAALASLTESLSLEFKDTNIVINCLALGAVQTEMLAAAFPGYKAPVNPSEMAEFIVNFAINGAKVFNGKVIPVAFTNP